MPTPKEYQEARAKLGGILERPIRISFLARGVKIPKRKEFEKPRHHISFLGRTIPKKREDPRIDEILKLRGDGWSLAIVSPRGKNRRIIWETEGEK